MANILAETVRKQGISSYRWVFISGLVMESGTAVMALGFDYPRGKALASLSKAVILANGEGLPFTGAMITPFRPWEMGMF